MGSICTRSNCRQKHNTEIQPAAYAGAPEGGLSRLYASPSSDNSASGVRHLPWASKGGLARDAVVGVFIDFQFNFENDVKHVICNTRDRKKNALQVVYFSHLSSKTFAEFHVFN